VSGRLRPGLGGARGGDRIADVLAIAFADLAQKLALGERTGLE
jgi:hypothetical protein